jgi:hypothetical protein
MWYQSVLIPASICFSIADTISAKATFTFDPEVGAHLRSHNVNSISAFRHCFCNGRTAMVRSNIGDLSSVPELPHGKCL